MIWRGFILALFFWIFESAVHAFVFGEGTFAQELVTSDMNELWMRFVVCALLLAFGIYSHVTMKKMGAVVLEREQLQKHLEKSLTHVLSGFVHICTTCKSIRSDHDTWDPIETYLPVTSETSISYALCPKCAKKLYPEKS